MPASEDMLSEKLTILKLENQLLQEELSNQEKKALIKQIKKKYGRNWRNVLNVKDNTTMRQLAQVGEMMSTVVPQRRNDGQVRHR